jgi:OmpA-OmpF porin, OOP family
MSLSTRCAFLALVLLSGCGQLPSTAGPARSDLAAVLPEEGGKVGAIVVHYTGGAQVLHTAYAGVQIRGAGKVESVTLDAEEVDKMFGPALAALPSRPASFTLYFLENSDELTPESRQSLTRVVAEIASRPAPEVAIIGHTDLVGSDQYNDALSTQRAQRVRDELVRAGIPAERVEVASRGKREPLYRTAEGVAEPRNRRVELNVR